VTIELVRATLG